MTDTPPYSGKLEPCGQEMVARMKTKVPETKPCVVVLKPLNSEVINMHRKNWEYYYSGSFN